MRIKIIIIFLCLIIFTPNVFSQKKINYKASWSETDPSYPDEIFMFENVEFEHEGMKMYCDSAVFNEKENHFRAFRNIHIIQNDSLHVWGDEMYYDGTSKIAEMFGERVVMQDNQITLITTYLILERIPNTVSYTRWADIYDNQSTLRSRQATYDMTTKDIHFVRNVEITSEKTKVYSDTMVYNTNTDIATFHGPTNIITSDSTYIYTELGWYNTKTEESMSYKQSQMLKEERILQADTLFYNSLTKIGEGIRNVYFEDSIKHVILTSHKAFFDNSVDSNTYTFLTQQALMRQINDSDTLFLHADTLWINHDTSMNVKEVFAYFDAKLFREDIQGAADRIYFNMNDSLLYMLGRPIIWSEESQITADTIIMNIGEKYIYSVDIFPKAFMVQDADTLSDKRYNQIYGKRMKAFFKKNRLYLVEVYGNAQSIYYIWEEEKNKSPKLMGINIGSGSEMKIYISKNKINKITTITNPVFYTDDEDNVKEEEKVLKGFEWRINERPLKPLDIFIKR
ncbi:MAG: OstA-like protein [Bacteroidales bacterium]|nr:OstA-like protein [Bacteroidales bacterium]MDD4703975.1 OstA-like protein [Bacteroidales bacterium]